MNENIKITRDLHGIPHIEADDLKGLFTGQGYVHARDRGLQMILMRILGKGRASELLDSGDDTLQIDIFFRKMNWSGNTREELESLTPEFREYINSYCEGVNSAFKEKYPWEFRLLKYSPELWTPEDTIMISRMIGYLTLAQSQAEIERLFIEMVQADISDEKLKELFPGILKDLDTALIKKVHLGERIVSPADLWNNAVPRMMASNNWVISGKRTKSGNPILSNDPHLEVNRLPNIWSEIVMRSGKKYIMGGTMPGFPGVLTGRTGKIAWGVTYSFIDAVDSWIEQCRDGKFFREEKNEWQDFKMREEKIKRKKKEVHTVTFYENDHGVLDGNPFIENYYLSTKWAASISGAASTTAILSMWHVETVEEGMEKLRNVETGWDFVLADKKGNIGFQMSGKVPKRRTGISGFIPLPGWKKENDWQGYINPVDLPRSFNPATGYFATANNDLNNYGKADPINMPMGSYRADRINQLLEKKTNATVDDMFNIQSDVYSLQAEMFMKILLPNLPDSANGDILRNWDMKYDLNSKGAYLFEKFYQELMKEVFGRNGFGVEAFEFLKKETGIYIDFYQNFDRILLSEESEWFGGISRNNLFRKAAETALDCRVKRWGKVQKFRMLHLIFGKKLPLLFGFDRGPIRIAGGRATIQQGQIYRSAGRVTTFMPSYRTVSDLGNEDFFSNLAGGPSDRRFSKWYISDLKNWLEHKFKKLSPECSDSGNKF